MAPTAVDAGDSRILHILHFNDVYNIESGVQEPVGGAARFCTALKSFSHLEPLVLFSGDIFAPSFMSTITKGEQMVPVLNACGVHCSVYGNHDFDFGIEMLVQRAGMTSFPWLMSNVIDNETGKPLANGKGSLVIDWQGIRIGLIGLVEKEWLDTLASIDPGHVTYTDYVDCGRVLARNLKQVKGCNIVIALTHMRTPNDKRLAHQVEEIDLILGGHDHVSEFIQIENRWVIKSGTDFRHFSHITMKLDVAYRPMVERRLIAVTSQFHEDEALKLQLDKFTSVIGEKMNEVLATLGVPLDGRFSSIRTSETNLGNLICDIMIAATDSDLALLNSGTLRSDRIHETGAFTLRDLNNILPMLDPLVVIEVTGRDVLAALENGVCQYPKLEGRFLQVSGVSFAFDPTKASGQRVDSQYVRVGDEYLEMDTKYRLVTKSYMAAGKDGFDCLSRAKVLVDEEVASMLNTSVQNHFKALQHQGGKFKRQSKHRQSLVTLSRRHSMVRTQTTEPDTASTLHPPPSDGIRLRRGSSIESPPNVDLLLAPNSNNDDDVTNLSVEQVKIDDNENIPVIVDSRIEGRIVVLNEETLPELIQQRRNWEAQSSILIENRT